MLALVVVAASAGFLVLRDDSPPVDEAERAAVESFAQDVLEVEFRREGVVAEFERVGADIRTTEYTEVFSTLESVIPKQEQLAQEIRSLNSPSNVTALAHTLLTEAYEKELEGYRLLNVVAGRTQAVFPESTARRLRRFDNYRVAVNRLNNAERSRDRAYEELEEVLARVGMSLEEVRSTN